jgi:hypothetical protein
MLRQAQAQPRAEQPTLFELRDDRRPLGERNAADRYCEPSPFTVSERLSRRGGADAEEDGEGVRRSSCLFGIVYGGSTPSALKIHAREIERPIKCQVGGDGTSSVDWAASGLPVGAH